MITIENKIEDFIKKHSICTGGSIEKYKIIVKKIEDGDIYYRLIIPFWSQNEYVVEDIFKFINSIRKNEELRTQTIYLKENYFIIDIFESICDPD